MTANQIMIPLILIALAIFAIVLVVQSTEGKRRWNAPKKHGPRSPPSQDDRGAMATKRNVRVNMGSDK